MPKAHARAPTIAARRRPRQERAAPSGVQAAGQCLAALAAAAALLGAPLDAAAVSGGGGISENLSYQDLSNRDLRKNKFVKVTMRETNFSGSDLTGAWRLHSRRHRRFARTHAHTLLCTLRCATAPLAPSFLCYSQPRSSLTLAPCHPSVPNDNKPRNAQASRSSAPSPWAPTSAAPT
jgi:hypothetical protein